MPKIKNWSRVDETELELRTEESRQNIRDDDMRDDDQYLEYKKGWQNDRFPFIKVFVYKTHKFDEYDISIEFFGETQRKNQELHGYSSLKEASKEAVEYLEKHGGREYNKLQQVHLPDEFEIHVTYKFEYRQNKNFRKIKNRRNYDPTGYDENFTLIPLRCKKTLEDFLTLYYVKDDLNVGLTVYKEELQEYRDWRGTVYEERNTDLEDILEVLERQVSFFKTTQGTTDAYEIASAGSGLAQIENLARQNMGEN